MQTGSEEWKGLTRKMYDGTEKVGFEGENAVNGNQLERNLFMNILLVVKPETRYKDDW